MRKSLTVISLAALAVMLLSMLAGCSSNSREPLEDARSLESNGFTTSYHQYMWTLVGSNESGELTEATYSHHESNSFFSIVRISAEAAKAQGLSGPAAMETLLSTYVVNYAGSNENITNSDNELEYIRSLTFEYDDASLNEKFTYEAKMVMNKGSGELMIILAGYPKSSDTLLIGEIALIMDSAVIEAIVAT